MSRAPTEPGAASLLKLLPDIADSMAARLNKLAQNHDPILADEIIRDASGLTALAMRIATALRRERERGDDGE